jgi:hypothetical protein
VDDWLEGGLPGRSEGTRSIYQEALMPPLERIGAKPLRELTARDVPIEEIARLAGRNRTTTTELVYRHELRPVITTGAEVMDRILNLRC